MRQKMIREAVQKFSESVRLPSVDDLCSTNLDSEGEEITFLDGLHGAVREPGKHASGETKTILALASLPSQPSTPSRAEKAKVVDTSDDLKPINKLGREARGRVEEETALA